MDIDELQAKLHEIGVDVPEATLKRWGYDEREIIPRPERYKHGRGSGKRGRAASWSDEAAYEAAAVWAVLHSPRTVGPPPLSLIPDIKRAARQPYASPVAGYVLSTELSADLKSQKEITYKSIDVHFGHGESLGKGPAEMQVLLTTWIAAKEKARRGIKIDTPQQVRFHWRSVKKDGLVTYIPEKVNDDHVLLYDSESSHDEIVIMINGDDVRKTVFRVLGFSKDRSQA
jgi:hypothetical protein